MPSASGLAHERHNKYIMGIQYRMNVTWDVTLRDLQFVDSSSVDPTLNGLVQSAIKTTTGAPTATAGYFMPGAIIQNAVSGLIYQNTGSTASPAWSIMENSGDVPLNSIAYNTDATAGASTLLAAVVVNAILDRDGGTAARTDVTDTATAILAAVPGAIIGTEFTFYYRNTSATAGQTLTLTGGTGVTISGDATVKSGGVSIFKGRFTNVTTPALTLYSVETLGDREVTGAKLSTGVGYFTVCASTNATTPVNVIAATVPFACTITGVYLTAKDATASNITVEDTAGTVAIIAKGTTAGVMVGADALTNTAVAVGDVLTVVSSGAGEAFVFITFTVA